MSVFKMMSMYLKQKPTPPKSDGEEENKPTQVSKASNNKLALALFEKYTDRLLSKAKVLIAAYPQVPLSPEDLVYSVWQHFFKAVQNYDPKKNNNLEAYIFYINNFAMRDVLREYSSQRYRAANEALSLDESVDVSTREDLVIQYEILDTKLGRIVHDILEPEELWEIFNFLYIEERSKYDIAKITGLSYYEITKQIKRIKFLLTHKVRPLLEKEFL